MGINGRVLFFSTVLRLSIMNKNSKYANSTWTKRLCHANLYPGSGGCRMWQRERREGARGRGYSHPTHTSGVQKSAIGKHLKATLPTSVLNGRVHKSYCKISELQRCFYCCTYWVCIYICYDIVFSFLVYLHFAVQNFLAFRNLLFHTLPPLLPPPVSIGMCIEFYFSALHTDKLFW